jgi:excisionase family DNA binding protein
LSGKTKGKRGRRPRHVGASSTKPTRSFSERNGVLMTQDEVADYLGVKSRNVQRMRDAGVGPKVTYIGRLVRYHIEDVDAWIEQQRDGGET